MPPVISFIGWHNSGKTTLASQVVARLKEKGYTVAVVKSTKDTGIEMDQPQTDTAAYRKAGADSVALVAPDQLIIRGKPPKIDLLGLTCRYFFDMDIVIAEGFKHAAHVPKIEVRRDEAAPLLRDQVEGVVAVVTDQPLPEGLVFCLDQSREIADFIETRLLTASIPPATQISLTLDGERISLPEPLCSQLEATILALLPSLPAPPHRGALELNIRCPPPEETT